MIHVSQLQKSFQVFDRREGIVGAVKDLVHRRYHEKHAVKDISFDIPQGDIVGYIGANGAGKSTTIKMLTGILHPSSGTIEVAGFVPHQNRMNYLRNIGVVFGQRSQLWWDLAVQESMRLLQKIYGVSEADYQARMKRFDEIMGLNEFLATPVRKLSLGQKMRCEVAAALLHNPKVVFLDEPTIGLDVVAKVAIRDFLKDINREFGITVILTTHDLKDIEELCQRVMIIESGSLIFDGQLDHLKSQLGDQTRLRFQVAGQETAHDLRHKLTDVPVSWLDEEDGVVAQFSRNDIRRAEVIRHVLNTVVVNDIAMEDMSIEDIVHKIYEQRGVQAPDLSHAGGDNTGNAPGSERPA